jgi:hypothetical protein
VWLNPWLVSSSGSGTGLYLILRVKAAKSQKQR